MRTIVPFVVFMALVYFSFVAAFHFCFASTVTPPRPPLHLVPRTRVDTTRGKGAGTQRAVMCMGVGDKLGIHATFG